MDSPNVVDMQNGCVMSLSEFQSKNLLVGYSGQEQCLLDYAKKQAKKMQIPRFSFEDKEVGIDVMFAKKILWDRVRINRIPSQLVGLIESLQEGENVNLWILTQADRGMAEMVKAFLCWAVQVDLLAVS
ncbi:MAG: hypothetical protein ACRCT1_07485 [Microcoleaceae cyanobacterium]